MTTVVISLFSLKYEEKEGKGRREERYGKGKGMGGKRGILISCR